VTIFAAVVLEAAAIAALGMALGFVLYGATLVAVGSVMRAQTGVVLDPFKFNAVLLWAPAMLVTLGALAGLVPAVKAYRTDVAEYLAPTS